MQRIDTDATSGTEIWRLTDGLRPADNIYGEQPYGSEDGSRIALRYFVEDDAIGELFFFDLHDNSVHPIMAPAPAMPSFHGWGTHLYCQQEQDDELVLRRWNYLTLQVDDVLVLPRDRGRFSYGTVSSDGQHFVVCAHGEPGEPCRILYFHLSSGDWRELLVSPEHYFKHEQFSRDGLDRLMIQANSLDRSRVGLGVLSLAGELAWLAADAPHTPRPSGHEAWIGKQSRVFFSSDWNDPRGNLWTVGCGDDAPIHLGPSVNGGHVSVSACGRYWLVDDNVAGVPLSVGSFASGRSAHLVVTDTVHNDQQSSHAHPYLTADNAWAIFTSNREGLPQVYGARLPSGLLDCLG